jgi:hypothetical protein
MACRASAELDGSECRTLSRMSSASPPAWSGNSRSGASATLRGVSQRQTQRFQLSPQRQPFLERQLMRRYLGNAVERHIQFVECRMDLLFSNGNHAATLSLGTDKSASVRSRRGTPAVRRSRCAESRWCPRPRSSAGRRGSSARRRIRWNIRSRRGCVPR